MYCNILMHQLSVTTEGHNYLKSRRPFFFPNQFCIACTVYYKKNYGSDVTTVCFCLLCTITNEHYMYENSY
jgi:hypothetical protein